MTIITRRGLLQAGAAIGAMGALGRYTALGQEMSAHEKQLYEAAKKEGEVTWYSGQLSTNRVRPLARPSAPAIRASRPTSSSASGGIPAPYPGFPGPAPSSATSSARPIPATTSS